MQIEARAVRGNLEEPSMVICVVYWDLSIQDRWVMNIQDIQKTNRLKTTVYVIQSLVVFSVSVNSWEKKKEKKGMQYSMYFFLFFFSILDIYEFLNFLDHY